MDNLFAVEEHLGALSTQIQAMVTRAIRQGATTVLAAAQLQIGTVVNLRVPEQGFPPRSMDDDITDLIESFEPTANAVLLKLDVDEIMHANLDP